MTTQQSAYVGIKKHNTCINSTFIWPLKSSMCNTWVRNEHMEKLGWIYDNNVPCLISTHVIGAKLFDISTSPYGSWEMV